MPLSRQVPHRHAIFGVMHHAALDLRRPGLLGFGGWGVRHWEGEERGLEAEGQASTRRKGRRRRSNVVVPGKEARDLVSLLGSWG